MLHDLSNRHFTLNRQQMIQELHQKLSSIPPPPIQPGEYYAVDYVKNCCFGSVLDSDDSFAQFKFLHIMGATKYHWPRQHDIDRQNDIDGVHHPFTVPSFIGGPFQIPEQQAVEKLFKAIRKPKRVQQVLEQHINRRMLTPRVISPK